MRLLSEVVEHSWHPKFVAHAVYERDVHRSPARVPAAIFARIRDISLIANEIPHSLLDGKRPVAVVDFQTHPLTGEFLLNPS